MTAIVDDGGQAFPVRYTVDDDAELMEWGMSLRQWYAGMALQGILSSNQVPIGEYGSDWQNNRDQAVQRSVMLADEMIKTEKEAKADEPE